MFTGIVEGLGAVTAITPRGAAYKIVIDLRDLARDVAVGDSVAIDGTCLTATELRKSLVSFDVISETVALTSLATLQVGSRVNIERSMAANGRFHGHIVAGHVDGTARIHKIIRGTGQTTISFEASERLTQQMIPKGSITIDGISLTLIEVTKTGFAVALIPHTLKITSLGFKSEGELVNIEVDQMGKWVRRILSNFVPGVPAPPETEREGLIEPPSVLRNLDDLQKYGL